MEGKEKIESGRGNYAGKRSGVHIKGCGIVWNKNRMGIRSRLLFSTRKYLLHRDMFFFGDLFKYIENIIRRVESPMINYTKRFS